MKASKRYFSMSLTLILGCCESTSSSVCLFSPSFPPESVPNFNVCFIFQNWKLIHGILSQSTSARKHDIVRLAYDFKIYEFIGFFICKFSVELVNIALKWNFNGGFVFSTYYWDFCDNEKIKVDCEKNLKLFPRKLFGDGLETTS